MTGRLVQAADFQRLLSVPSRQRSTHFALHHVLGRPAVTRRPSVQVAEGKLSTEQAQTCPEPVDDSVKTRPIDRWWGCVVPKRHARRSVTRSFLKRQIRAAAQRHGERLGPGLWLVRFRSPFALTQFPSADSAALREAARLELDHLLGQARAAA